MQLVKVKESSLELMENFPMGSYVLQLCLWHPHFPPRLLHAILHNVSFLFTLLPSPGVRLVVSFCVHEAEQKLKNVALDGSM